MTTPKVFISYSHDDTEWVRSFAEALRDQNVDVWFDEWSVAPGEPLVDAIEVGLRESETIVFVISRSNALSPNVLFELGAAIGMGKRTIPIVSKDLDLSLVPFDLRKRRFIVKGPPAEIAQVVASAVKVNK